MEKKFIFSPGQSLFVFFVGKYRQIFTCTRTNVKAMHLYRFWTLFFAVDFCLKYSRKLLKSFPVLLGPSSNVLIEYWFDLFVYKRTREQETLSFFVPLFENLFLTSEDFFFILRKSWRQLEKKSTFVNLSTSVLFFVEIVFSVTTAISFPMNIKSSDWVKENASNDIALISNAIFIVGFRLLSQLIYRFRFDLIQ